jgi:hypothetical protein
LAKIQIEAQPFLLSGCKPVETNLLLKIVSNSVCNCNGILSMKIIQKLLYSFILHDIRKNK